MACSIQINDVRGHRDASGALTSIEIAGTAEECDRIEVIVSCLTPTLGGTEAQSQIVNLISGESGWETLLTELPGCADCGRPITVEAYCLLPGDVRHPDCQARTINEPLACGSECPRVFVDRTPSDECSGGLRGVEFSVEVDAPDDVIVETRLHYGDGTASRTSTERSYSYTRMYEPGVTVHPRLEVIRPAGCPDMELESFWIEECPEDGPIDRPHCPTGMEAIPGPIIVTGDGCKLTWFANLSGPIVDGTYTWRFAEDDETEATREPFVERKYSESGTYTIVVDFDPDSEECHRIRASAAVEIEGCRPAKGEDVGCIVLRTVAIIGIAISLALIAASICITDPSRANAVRIGAAALLVVSTIVFILWLIFCANKPCKPWLLLAGLTLLGAGFTLVHAAGCCPALAGVGPATAIAGGALLLRWRKACNISWCSLSKEIALFTGGTLPVAVTAIVIALPPGCLPALSEGAIEATILVVFDLAFAGIGIQAWLCEGGHLGDIGDRESPTAREVPAPHEM